MPVTIGSIPFLMLVGLRASVPGGLVAWGCPLSLARWASPTWQLVLSKCKWRSQRGEPSKMEVIVFCNLIMTVASLHFCQILSIWRKPPDLAHIKEEDINTRSGGLWVPSTGRKTSRSGGRIYLCICGTMSLLESDDLNKIQHWSGSSPSAAQTTTLVRCLGSSQWGRRLGTIMRSS